AANTGASIEFENQALAFDPLERNVDNSRHAKCSVTVQVRAFDAGFNARNELLAQLGDVCFFAALQSAHCHLRGCAHGDDARHVFGAAALALLLMAAFDLRVEPYAAPNVDRART